MTTTIASALDYFFENTSPYDWTHDSIMAAAIEDGWTAAGADALAAQEIAALDEDFHQQAAAEMAAEAGYEYWLETRYNDSIMAEPEWAR